MASPYGGRTFSSSTTHPAAVSVSIDNQPALPLKQVDGSTLWMLLTKMRTGVTTPTSSRRPANRSGARRDVVGYNPDSYPKPGVPKGKVSEKQTITSKIYDGTTADYWVYASPGVDPAVPAALMVWQDGQGSDRRLSRIRLFTVTENLVAQKLHAADRPRDDLARHARRAAHALHRVRHRQR